MSFSHTKSSFNLCLLLATSLLCHVPSNFLQVKVQSSPFQFAINQVTFSAHRSNDLSLDPQRSVEFWAGGQFKWFWLTFLAFWLITRPELWVQERRFSCSHQITRLPVRCKACWERVNHSLEDVSQSSRMEIKTGPRPQSYQMYLWQRFQNAVCQKIILFLFQRAQQEIGQSVKTH